MFLERAIVKRQCIPRNLSYFFGVFNKSTKTNSCLGTTYLSNVAAGEEMPVERHLCLVSLCWRLLTSRVDLSTHLSKCL